MKRLLRVASCEKGKTCPRLAAFFLINYFVIIATILLGASSFAADPFLAAGERVVSAPEVPLAYLRQNDFYIPYQLNDESDANAPLNLYVSKNRGQSWELYKSLVPATETTNGSRQFNVRVGSDGEYWFAIRPSRMENSPTPNLGARPDLRIIIDTTAPIMKIETQKTGEDQLTIYWTLTDRNPDADTVHFYQRYSETADWTPIPLNSRSTVLFNNPDGSAGATGQFTIQVSRGIPLLYIRGEAQDKAKIPTVVLWNVPLTGAAGTAYLPGAARQNVVGTDALARGEFRSAFLNPSGESADAQSGAGSAGTIPSSGSVPEWSAVRDNPPLPGANNLATSTRVQRPILPRIPADFSTATIINKTRFNLDYDITSVGRSGVGTVELWATRNRGADWYLLAKDNDNITPIAVEVSEDGVYGLKLVVENGAGIGGRRPVPGEAPASWLVLDRTAPIGELKSAEIRVDTSIPQMRLHWVCSDDYPSPTPVALYWSRDGQEPWSLIADQLPPIGDYLWTMPNDVPARIIIKMEMQDKAGNVNSSMSRPIAADAFSPQGYIRGIHPIE